MNRKSYCLLTLIIVLIPLISLSPLVYCDSDDYELGIEENTKVVWRINEVDEEQLEDFFDDSDELDDSYFDYEEDDKVRFDINSISENSEDEYYTVSYTEFVNDESKGARAQRIAMDPKDIAEDWEEDFDLGEFSIMFILTDTKDYLDDFEEEIDPIYKLFVYVSGSSIIINNTLLTPHFWLKMDYNEDGILEEFTFVLDGDEIFAMELRSYSEQDQFPLLGLIIAIVISSLLAIVIGVVVLVVVLVKRAKKKRNVVPTAPIKTQVDTKPEGAIRTKEPTEAGVKEEPEKIDYGYCEKCGSKRESDAAFCSYCGSKF